MEMTEEGKEKEIKQLPNSSGFIHSKSQIEQKNNNKAKENNNINDCFII